MMGVSARKMLDESTEEGFNSVSQSESRKNVGCVSEAYDLLWLLYLVQCAPYEGCNDTDASNCYKLIS